MGLKGVARPEGAISRTSIAIAALSTVVEWYDFTLYLYFATVLARVFFGGGRAGLTLTLGGFAVAYLMRPLGAAFFGYLGDRHGRRRVLLASMGLMTAAMLVTALLPTHAQVGATSGVLLLLLRCVMAFSVGAEYTGVVAYLLEGARIGRRGLITSLAASSSEVGALLAAGVAATTVSLTTSSALETWGWRIPFLIGAALAGTVGLTRSWMEESPEFERQRAIGSVPRRPLRDALASHRAGVGRGFAISALGSITYYVGISYVPTFLVRSASMAEREALWLSTFAAVLVILVSPVVGALSDRFGRRPLLVVLCGGSMLVPVTMFAWMANGSYGRAVVGALILAALGGGVSAVGAVATAEQFPGEGRLSGLAIGATTATAIFGGLSPFVAEMLMAHFASPTVPGVMIALVAVVVLPVLLAMPETRPE